ncbi:MAG: glycosyltransferase family 4 protein [Planctomycetaceae bacterium]|nr:glycosyltransferase family 4 protein [Planctomycetaceae bacterium]
MLTNAPSPYQAELLTAISELKNIELDVRFMVAGSPAGRAASSRFPFKVMRSLTPGFLREELLIHPRAIWECAFTRHDCYVLSGMYTSLTFLLCVCVLSLRRVPWLVWFERPHPKSLEDSNWSPRLIMSGPARRIRAAVHQWILKSANRVICIGTSAKEAYEEFGLAEDKLDVLPYCCDVERYDHVNPSTVEVVRQRHQLAGRTVFLFSGQMIERKGVDTALRAFEQVARQHQDVSFILLGDGPLRSSLMSQVSEDHRSQIHFPGHIAQEELPAYFAAADVFVFPSRHDGWGVVINEACAARLPVITTRQTGAARDLVEEGRSGFVLERDDVDGFARSMKYFVTHPEDRESFGARSRELVNAYSPEKGAERFQQAVARAVQ